MSIRFKHIMDLYHRNEFLAYIRVLDNIQLSEIVCFTHSETTVETFCYHYHRIFSILSWFPLFLYFKGIKE
jgi:hypothetical protein